MINGLVLRRRQTIDISFGGAGKAGRIEAFFVCINPALIYMSPFLKFLWKLTIPPLVSPQKGGVILKPALITACSSVFAQSQKLPCTGQPFFRDIVPDGEAGFFFKNTHHVVGA